MNNNTIILMERCNLMNAGILKGTGKFIEIDTGNGVKKIEEPEEIHTYARWRELGYQVRRGEKSEIKIQVWKYRGKIQIDDESGEEIQTGRCFLKVASFFTMSQVDAIV